MSKVVSKLYSKNLVYIPQEYLVDSGISDSKMFVTDYDPDTKKITLWALSKEDAEKVSLLSNQKQEFLNTLMKD